MKKEDYAQCRGLYDPEREHDACGVGLVVQIDGTKSHEIVEEGMKVLENMQHRGAEGADGESGDGAGIMTQVPHEFILLQGVPLPERGRYGTGIVFLPRKREESEECLDAIRRALEERGLELVNARDVPRRSDLLRGAARLSEPDMKQLFVTGTTRDEELERELFVARKLVERRLAETGDPGRCYIASLSTRLIVYKGMLTSSQLRLYFQDLTNPYFTSAIALVHSRFSTNTFPAWSLAQPFRLLGHNGEINTIRGNRSWTRAHESVMLNEEKEVISPIIQPGMSDSASLDNMLEFLVASGVSLPEALAMLVPESRNDRNPIPNDLRAFFEYHGTWMAPWDGPATLLFSDGRRAGGMLDRNGLRPARYLVTSGGVLVMASETGVYKAPAGEIREKGRLAPGKMLIADTAEGRILRDKEIKATLAGRYPYREWLDRQRVTLDKIKSGRKVENAPPRMGRLLRAFGYTREEIDRVLLPMARDASEPISSMGSDIPLAALSDRPRLLFDYFRQQFAQVTNPPVDPIREELVMSLEGCIGAVEGNALEPSEEHCKGLRITGPVLSNVEMDILRNLRYKGFVTRTIDAVYRANDGAKGMEAAIEGIRREAERAVDDGCNYIILSDRGVDEFHAPVPSLLALSAAHDDLVAKRKRTQVALIAETGEARSATHIALLMGHGASAVNPYLAFAVLQELVARKELQLDYRGAEKRYTRAVNKGMLKIMSKMGISTLRGYRGARVFDVVGLSSSLLDAYFKGVRSKIEGADLEDIARDAARLHADGFAPAEEPDALELGDPGMFRYRKGGELHAWEPAVVAALQRAARSGEWNDFQEYARLANARERPIFLRDLLRVKGREPVALERVEPAVDIVKRFFTGGMSLGAISQEAHEIVAAAMNALGSRSNAGEGGEEPARDVPREDGASVQNKIRQVASGRFGVTTAYLVAAGEIQIKVAQGAKPGEGGQLPGYKVNEMIARTRHSIPGISLISPPPHHDVYSIEDLAQLIHDLKNVNPRARVSVKLVAESGVGAIAAGVAKAGADMILISGGEGGTGASPLSSIQHAGLPLELGLAETQQTLLAHGLRKRVALQADGQLKTGRDVLLTAMLGAQEFGFATAALVALGCVMARKCHLNTCPVGVATQDENLRERFKGTTDHLVNFLRLLAEDARVQLARAGFARLEDAIGRVDMLEQDRERFAGAKLSKIDLSSLLYRPRETARTRDSAPRRVVAGNAVDSSLLRLGAGAINSFRPTRLALPIKNTDRSTGAMLSGHITLKYGEQGLPDDTLRVCFDGSAGQSFGAFLCRGVTLELSGDVNDYLGKGLSGGRVIVKPPAGSLFAPEENVIAGNTLLYGATSGEVFINGRAGERFCVRNSGATAVVEGVGDHCCEYMTGGRVVVLGPTGRNFAAGMSGGIAYVWNPNGNFDYFCNMEMVELSLVDERDDDDELRALIATHYRHTASPLAGRMLAGWKIFSEQFIKVTPIEYKKVLELRALKDLEQKIANIERDY
ncbi:MAG: glutamate synthase large subunit [Odoribacteraceae bacterium]|nr:glutamate synthase large subunit [Odoribacteraceae bacterium]